MSDKEAIRLLHDALKHKARWYIDIHCPDIAEFKDIAQKAKLKAGEALTTLSKFQLYARYILWRKSSPIIDTNIDYFDCFLNDVLFDLGRRALRGLERTWFEDNCYLSIHFI